MEKDNIFFYEKIKSICIQQTRMCNLNCEYCAQGGPGSDNNEIAHSLLLAGFLMKYKNIVSKNFQLNLIGGEILLKFEEMKKVIDVASKFSDKVYYCIITNGVLLKEQKIQNYINLLPYERTKIAVSFDSAKKGFFNLAQEAQDYILNLSKREQLFTSYVLNGREDFPAAVKEIQTLNSIGIKKVRILYNFFKMNELNDETIYHEYINFLKQIDFSSFYNDSDMHCDYEFRMPKDCGMLSITSNGEFGDCRSMLRKQTNNTETLDDALNFLSTHCEKCPIKRHFSPCIVSLYNQGTKPVCNMCKASYIAHVEKHNLRNELL